MWYPVCAESRVETRVVLLETNDGADLHNLRNVLIGDVGECRTMSASVCICVFVCVMW